MAVSTHKRVFHWSPTPKIQIGPSHQSLKRIMHLLSTYLLHLLCDFCWQEEQTPYCMGYYGVKLYNTKQTNVLFQTCTHSARAKIIQNMPSKADFYKLLLVFIVIARKQEQGKVQAPSPLHYDCLPESELIRILLHSGFLLSIQSKVCETLFFRLFCVAPHCIVIHRVSR